MNPSRPPQIYRLRTPNSPASPKICRDTVALLLNATGHHELTDAAGLLVSELVTNVGLHTRSLAVRLETVVRLDRVRVSVYDDEPARPAPPPAIDLGAENGRGLLLIEAMAQSWGVGSAHPHSPYGKHIWFELRGHG
ncbi:ATP-binding protein [Streptomyces bobili]|uniref:ATP-binding protein n=1 Tax=Streptomyces bobili TaxID=67280 RepID=UPI003659776C